MWKYICWYKFLMKFFGSATWHMWPMYWQRTYRFCSFLYLVSVFCIYVGSYCKGALWPSLLVVTSVTPYVVTTCWSYLNFIIFGFWLRIVAFASCLLFFFAHAALNDWIYDLGPSFGMKELWILSISVVCERELRILIFFYWDVLNAES